MSRGGSRAGQGHTQERGEECEDRAVPGVGGGKGSQKAGAVPGRGRYQQMMQGWGEEGLGKMGARGWIKERSLKGVRPLVKRRG